MSTPKRFVVRITARGKNNKGRFHLPKVVYEMLGRPESVVFAITPDGYVYVEPPCKKADKVPAPLTVEEARRIKDKADAGMVKQDDD